MRKQDFIHTHALLLEVAHYLFDQEDMPSEVLDEYDALDTRPVNIYESKQKHREATMALATAIRSWLKQTPDGKQETAISDQ